MSVKNRLLRRVVTAMAMAAAAGAAGGSPAFADNTDPVAGSGPSSAGMPGADLVQQIL